MFIKKRIFQSVDQQYATHEIEECVFIQISLELCIHNILVAPYNIKLTTNKINN